MIWCSYKFAIYATNSEIILTLCPVLLEGMIRFSWVSNTQVYLTVGVNPEVMLNIQAYHTSHVSMT